MKNVKKLLAALLVLSMVLALTGTAFAAKNTPAPKVGKFARFTGHSWGYHRVSNNHGKDKSTVLLRKGSLLYVVGKKGDWYKCEIPSIKQKGKTLGTLWFNKEYMKLTSYNGVPKPLFSSGGGYRSYVDYVVKNGLKGKNWVKLTGKHYAEVRSEGSLSGKIIGKLRGHKKLKLCPSKSYAVDSREIEFYKVWWGDGVGWVSNEFAKAVK